MKSYSLSVDGFSFAAIANSESLHYVYQKAGYTLPKNHSDVRNLAIDQYESIKKQTKSEIQEAKDTDILLSLHLKATMMKVSDPILFGHCVKAYFKAAYDKHSETLEKIGANPNNGLGSVLSSIDAKLPPDEAAALKADFDACYEDRPWLAMVNSDKGITNLVRFFT